VQRVDEKNSEYQTHKTMKTNIISLLSIGFFLLACNSEILDNPNESPILTPPFFYELVDEEGLNFFTTNPDISFEEVKIMVRSHKDSGGKGALVEAGGPMIINGRKVLSTSANKEVYIFYGNGNIDIINHWRDSDKEAEKKNKGVWWNEDPVYYYSFNGVYQGKFDVLADELYLKNNIYDPVRFDPQIAVIRK